MSETTGVLNIQQSHGWVEVLAVAGFVVVNNQHDFEFAYSDTQPTLNFVGNKHHARVVNNNSTSKLWIRTKEYPLEVVINEE